MAEAPRLEATLAGVQAHMAERPGNRALESIVEQLEYLVAYARGENDGSRRAQMNMGVLAMREIEQAGDLDLAMAIYRLESDAHRAVGRRDA